MFRNLILGTAVALGSLTGVVSAQGISLQVNPLGSPVVSLGRGVNSYYYPGGNYYSPGGRYYTPGYRSYYPGYQNYNYRNWGGVYVQPRSYYRNGYRNNYYRSGRYW